MARGFTVLPRENDALDTNRIIDSTTTTDGKWKYEDDDVENDDKITVTTKLDLGGITMETTDTY